MIWNNFGNFNTNKNEMLDIDKIRAFIKNFLIGGLLVILPVAIITSIFAWVYKMVHNLVQPIVTVFVDKGGIQDFLAFIIVVSFMIWACFFVGVVVKTKFGAFFHDKVEKNFLNKLIGYKTIKEIVLQFIGNKEIPFSSVAIVDIFDNKTRMTGFITDRSYIDNKLVYSVFVPTGPNPTSGNIFHLPEDKVNILDIPVEKGMKSIIACGNGSKELLEGKDNNKPNIENNTVENHYANTTKKEKEESLSNKRQEYINKLTGTTKLVYLVISHDLTKYENIKRKGLAQRIKDSHIFTNNGVIFAKSTINKHIKTLIDNDIFFIEDKNIYKR